MRTSVYILFIFLVIVYCGKSEMSDPREMEPDSEEMEEPDNEEMEPETRSWQLVLSADGSEPIPRHEAAFVVVGNNFYLLGGRGLLPVSIYNTDSQSWSQGSEPPLELHHFQPVVYENRIYIIGAMTGPFPSETPVANVYIYDPSNDTWTVGDEIPEDRRRGSTGNILHEGKIYVACGIKDGHRGDHKNWLDRYDPTNGNWEVLPDAPRTRDHFQAILVNDNIYVVAGRNTNAPDNTFSNTIAEVDVYDIQNSSWETLPNNLPTLRAGNAAMLYEGEVLVIGGESGTQGDAHSEVEALDVTTNTWRSLPPLLEGRHGTGVLEFNLDLFIASGSGKRGGSPELSTMEQYRQ